MKIVIIMILLMALCLIASSKPVAVGGDFGRTWINNFLDQNPKQWSRTTPPTSRAGEDCLKLKHW